MYEELEKVRTECLNCQKCELSKSRTQVVFSGGIPNSKLMLIGEAPGFWEDKKGEPFVGKAGQLLDKIFACVGLNRKEHVYICNTIKCRPPENRDPLPEEQEKCVNWLRNQVYIMRPKIIVTLGRIASLKIIDSEIKITRDHGIFTLKKGVWFMPTLHPAAVLRNMSKKPDVQDDFQKLKSKIEELRINVS